MRKVYGFPGVNAVKCENCGIDKTGKPIETGGNVFITIGMRQYAKLLHDCEMILEGRCARCNAKNQIKFWHPPAPNLLDDEDKEKLKRSLSK